MTNFPGSLIQSLRNAKKIVALTGAGISAESGLATFRDAQTGFWSKFRPEELATAQAFRRDPKFVRDWYRWRREISYWTRRLPVVGKRMDAYFVRKRSDYRFSFAVIPLLLGLIKAIHARLYSCPCVQLWARAYNSRHRDRRSLGYPARFKTHQRIW